MSNLFSSFDPSVTILRFNLNLNWISCFIILIILPQRYWLIRSQFLKRFEKLIVYLEGELLAIFRIMRYPGTIIIFLSFFFFLLGSNFLGLFPYIFTSTSHLSITLTISLPIWLGRISWSIFYQYNSIFTHLVPLGTPNALMPVIVIIETVSNIIRPGTLAVRLAANMVAGHLLLTLLGSQGPNVSYTLVLFIMASLLLLLALELAVACIQSYVFTVLSSLYLRELGTVGFSKLIA